MQFIATTYTGPAKNRLEFAASNCRAPYFDWASLPVASRDSMLPASIGDNPKINVSGPHGMQTIANPLFAYAFNPPNREVFQDVAPVSEDIVSSHVASDTDTISSGQTGLPRGEPQRVCSQTPCQTIPPSTPILCCTMSRTSKDSSIFSQITTISPSSAMKAGQQIQPDTIHSKTSTTTSMPNLGVLRAT